MQAAFADAGLASRRYVTPVAGPAAYLVDPPSPPPAVQVTP